MILQVTVTPGKSVVTDPDSERERKKRRGGRQKRNKQVTITYMQSHTPFSCNNVYVFKEGGGAQREKERRREIEKGGGGCVQK